MSDAAIEFKNELFYGDTITAFVTANNFSRVGFDLVYKLTRNDTSVAHVKHCGYISEGKCYLYSTVEKESVTGQD